MQGKVRLLPIRHAQNAHQIHHAHYEIQEIQSAKCQEEAPKAHPHYYYHQDRPPARLQVEEKVKECEDGEDEESESDDEDVASPLLDGSTNESWSGPEQRIFVSNAADEARCKGKHKGSTFGMWPTDAAAQKGWKKGKGVKSKGTAKGKHGSKSGGKHVKGIFKGSKRGSGGGGPDASPPSMGGSKDSKGHKGRKR